jgi:hypothetical protein
VISFALLLTIGPVTGISIERHIKKLQSYDVDSCIVLFHSFHFLSESQFSSQAFNIASLFLPKFPMVDFATPNCTAVAR